jgi:hypothetical protein
MREKHKTILGLRIKGEYFGSRVHLTWRRVAPTLITDELLLFYRIIRSADYHDLYYPGAIVLTVPTGAQLDDFSI